MKRAIQTNLQDALAVKILDGTFSDGDVIRVDTDGDQLVFNKG